MTHTTLCIPKRPTTTPASGRTAARSRHATSFSDAVVAVYIHGISARHRQPEIRRRPVMQV